jgi:hypothetical protein
MSLRKEEQESVGINVTLTRVRATIVAVEKPEVLHILSLCLLPYLSSTQRACAVLYCHLWPVWPYHIFPHYFINGTIFGKKLSNIKCVFWFSLQLVSETFLILRRIQRDITINAHRSLVRCGSTPFRCASPADFCCWLIRLIGRGDSMTYSRRWSFKSYEYNK